ncbi:MAG: hypothetical protein KGK34_12480 [Chloroflexota bacterium]|nr:hypothetical protein [Chloroflexota bacterium]
MTAAVVAGVLGLAVSGAAAFAAFQPSDAPTAMPATNVGTTAAAPATDTATTTARAHPAGADRVKAILDKLVQNGTITQAQEDAIVQAFKDAAGGKDKDGAKILASVVKGLMKASADYLGLPPGQLRQQLAAGQTLGQIADATAGKSRDGLIAALTTQVDAKIDQLAAKGTITADRAATIKAKVPDRLAKLVDHVFKRPGKAPKASPAT